MIDACLSFFNHRHDSGGYGDGLESEQGESPLSFDDHGGDPSIRRKLYTCTLHCIVRKSWLSTCAPCRWLRFLSRGPWHYQEGEELTSCIKLLQLLIINFAPIIQGSRIQRREVIRMYDTTDNEAK